MHHGGLEPTESGMLPMWVRQRAEVIGSQDSYCQDLKALLVKLWIVGREHRGYWNWKAPVPFTN